MISESSQFTLQKNFGFWNRKPNLTQERQIAAVLIQTRSSQLWGAWLPQLRTRSTILLKQ